MSARASTSTKPSRRMQRPGAHVDRMFRAFCDRTRLRILSLLADGELCVGDMVRILRAPQPRISRHLGRLREAGLVTARKDGLWTHYSLAPPSSEFHRKLLECAASCFREVPEIQADQVRAAKLRAAGRCCPTSPAPRATTRDTSSRGQ